MNNRMQKLFLSLTLALCAINSPSNAAQVVAAGLKGTYNDVPADVRALSPLHGAVMAENGDLKTLWADDKGPLGNLARKMFKEINGTMRITTQASNPVAVLSLDGITQIIEQIHNGKPCAALFFTEKKADLETLTPLGTQWLTAYKAWPTGDTIPKKERLFLEHAPAFLKAADTAAATDKPITERMLTAFVYLMSKTPQDLHMYFRNFYPALSDTSFTDDDYQTFTDLFTTTALDAKEAKTNVEQMMFWLLKKKSGSLYFLRAPQQYALIKKKEVPVCMEGAIQTAFNCMLYDSQTQELSFSNLNPNVLKTLNPSFKRFIEKHKNPHVTNYFKTTLDDTVKLLSNVPGIAYLQKEFELNPSTHNTLAVFNYLFGTQAKNFTELGKMLSSKTRTIQFSKSIILNEDDDDFDYDENDYTQDDIDPFEIIQKTEELTTPTEKTPDTSTETSDTASDDEDSYDEDDYDDEEISLLPTTEKQFITLTITNKNNPKNPVIVEMTIDPSKHSETNFVDKNGRVLTSTQLENISTVSTELGQQLLPIASIDWYRTIMRAFKEKVFADEESFLTFLQTYKPPTTSLTTPSDSDDYLIEEVMLLGRLDFLKALQRYGVDIINCPTVFETTTLFDSLTHQKSIEAKIPAYLISQGAQFDPAIFTTRDKNGKTPFLYVQQQVINGTTRLSALEELLKLKADPNLQQPSFEYTDNEGNPRTAPSQYPLSQALTSRKPKLFELLLKYGANPNVDNGYNTPLLSSALSVKNPIYAQLLLKHGANPNITYSTGIPLLLSEIWSKKSDNVKLLLEHGADPHIKHRGKSAVEYIEDYLPELYHYAKEKAEEWEYYDVD